MQLEFIGEGNLGVGEALSRHYSDRLLPERIKSPDDCVRG